MFRWKPKSTSLNHWGVFCSDFWLNSEGEGLHYFKGGHYPNGGLLFREGYDLLASVKIICSISTRIPGNHRRPYDFISISRCRTTTTFRRAPPTGRPPSTSLAEALAACPILPPHHTPPHSRLLGLQLEVEKKTIHKHGAFEITQLEMRCMESHSTHTAYGFN